MVGYASFPSVIYGLTHSYTKHKLSNIHNTFCSFLCLWNCSKRLCNQYFISISTLYPPTYTRGIFPQHSRIVLDEIDKQTIKIHKLSLLILRSHRHIRIVEFWLVGPSVGQYPLGVTFIRKKTLLNPLFSGAGGHKQSDIFFFE